MAGDKAGGMARTEGFRGYWAVLRGRRRAAVLVVVTGCAAGCAEALGLAALVPLLQTGLTNAGPTSAGAGGGHRVGVLLVVGFFVLTALAVLLRAVTETLIARLNGLLDRDLRAGLLRSVLALDWRLSGRLRQGDLVSALMSEATQLANGVSAVLNGLTALVVAVALAVTAGVLGPVMSLLAVGFAVVTFAVYQRSGRRSHQIQAALAHRNEAVSEEATQLLGNLKFLRSSGSRDRWAAELGSGLEALRRLRLKDVLVPTGTRAFVELLGALFLAGVLLEAVRHPEGLAQALVFLAVFYRVIPRLQVAQGHFLTARAQVVWVKRWRERAEGMRSGEAGGDVPPPHHWRTLELRGVTVAFPGRHHAALSGLSVRFTRGEVVAVVGSSGGGKSTLLDVVTGLLQPDAGDVLLDGRPLAAFDVDAWQRDIALVPQDPPVVHDSLLHNVQWLTSGDGNPVQRREDAMTALADAGLADFVRRLPDGIDTVVGTRGAALSGGQRQRLSIARALFRRPTVLILDEATSALDPVTEAEVLDNVLRRDPGKLVIFVTHRLATLHRVDRVLVVDGGRIVADCPPERLPAVYRHVTPDADVIGSAHAG